MVSPHTAPQLRTEGPVSLNRLRFHPSPHFPSSSLSLTALSEERPSVATANAQTAHIIEHNIDALLGQIGSPTIPGSVNVKLQMGQRNVSAVNATSSSLLRVRVRRIAGSAGSPRWNGQFGGPEVANANQRQRNMSSASGGETKIVFDHRLYVSICSSSQTSPGVQAPGGARQLH
jgi:hypothetical protein